MSNRVMAHLYSDMSRDYYVSDDWSPEFYLLQALRGFIAVGHQTDGGAELILPQLQTHYCVLNWSAVRSRKTLQKQARKLADYRLKVNSDLPRVLEKLELYHTGKSWLCPAYKQLLLDLHSHGTWTIGGVGSRADVDFRICSVELYDSTGDLVAGELGYIAGSVYTALTGFCKREKHLSLGKLQILAFATLLEREGFTFANLGQPPVDGKMLYKHEIGGVDIDRFEFLEMWNGALSTKPQGFGRVVQADIRLGDLFDSS